MITSALSLTERLDKERLSLLMKNAVVLSGQDKKRLYGNTFKMEPDVPFSSMLVEKVLKEIVDSEFERHIYDEEKSSKKCESISVEIRNRVKLLNFSRYKFVCLVTVAERRQSEMQMNSRCLWDPRFDSYASYTLTNKSVIVVAIVYGCYYE